MKDEERNLEIRIQSSYSSFIDVLLWYENLKRP